MKQVNKFCKTAEAWKQGYTGKGISCAVFDTGVYPHADLKNRLKQGIDLINHREKAYDDNGHGTEVAGIIAGDGSLSGGTYRGIAPGADIVSVKILDRTGNGKMENVTKGIHWVLKNRYVFGIRVVNLSVGTIPDEDDEKERELMEAVERLWDVGVVVVAAAGNLGPEAGSVTVPGNCPRIITVGALTNEKKRYERSGCGPTGACVVKPEILAPGFSVISCASGGKRYQKKSGTSMAAAVVSGSVALLLQKEPWLTPKEVKKRFYYSAVDLGLPQNEQGWGALNIKRLLNLQ